MSSEKFREFLEFQARRSPLNVNEGYISWEDKGTKETSSYASDFLESTYLGKDFQNTVVMERSVAAMLRHRLQELEKESDRLRRRIRIIKFIGYGVAVAAAIILWTIVEIIY